MRALLPIPFLAASLAAQTPPPDAERFLTDRDSPRVLRLTDEAPMFSFVVFGDRTGGPAEGVRVLAQAVDEVNVLGPDLVMTVGDLVQGYNITPLWVTQAIEFKSIMDRLAMPWYPVAGNHDVYWRGPLKPPLEHEGNYETHFGPLWYAFEHKHCWFVVLFSDETNPATGEKDFNVPDNHRMSPRQTDWLDRVLAKTHGAQHVFVFLHHPRWLGGQYGTHWDAMHQKFVAAGNVTAVFAGHIHRMTSTVRDGIQYHALATTGGAQSGVVPRAGWLHHYDIVTVREHGITVGAVPVGEVFDPSRLTEPVVQAARAAASEIRPKFDGVLALDEHGAVDGTLEFTLRNPLDYAVEVTLEANSQDPRWSVNPDHLHVRLAPGEERRAGVHVRRDDETIDGAFDLCGLTVATELLAPGVRIPVPDAVVTLPTRFALPAPAVPMQEHVLECAGDGALAVDDRALALPDGPLTVETWFRADAFADRTGLATKTEQSEFGLFVNRGVPNVSLHVAGSYVDVKAATAVTTDAWHHIAGVFDGAELRLYVDGVRVAAAPAHGARTRNRLPLLIGADVDKAGDPTSPFDGQIDEFRISKVARYAGDRFTPARRVDTDADTTVLFHMDAHSGRRFVFDASPNQAHGTRRGGVRVGLAR